LEVYQKIVLNIHFWEGRKCWKKRAEVASSDEEELNERGYLAKRLSLNLPTFYRSTVARVTLILDQQKLLECMIHAT
jgi:hypothetical protein